MISLFSTDSGDSLGTNDSPPVPVSVTTSSVAESSAAEDRIKTQKKAKSPTTVSYVNAKEIRCRLEENAACQPQRTFKVNLTMAYNVNAVNAQVRAYFSHK